MPIPAVPPPKMTIRWSASGIPVMFTPARTAARATAAVPWMSSLKVQWVCRYFSRMRWALPAPKSSQCSIAWGKSRVAVLTKVSMNSS